MSAGEPAVFASPLPTVALKLRAKPANGPEGLKAYDPEPFSLWDEFYAGKVPFPEKGTHRARLS
jgi:hypothetical protein